ncbi:hypothetical protein [Pseudomonas sp. LAIL14HWK12:I7]|uniref:hypothetical protein n=1 Tax=Pseudomonas sp. LAIL14HWK12:I7 TaxID=1259801 RepID=UPI00210BF659|nr:hypothetical protein [Pseudomonas sp. LAIL14HWK12:I7]
MTSAQKHHPESPTTSHPQETQLYIISISKLIIMAFLSMGLYLYYWHYRHWLLIRGQHGLRLIPLLCTIFGAVTIYFLMKKIVARCTQANRPVEGSAVGVTLMLYAPILMIVGWEFYISEKLFDSLPLSAFTLIPIMLTLLYTTFFSVAMVQIQQSVNVCEGDACGFENSKITWANVLWLIVCWMPITALFGYLSAYAPLMQ